MKKYLCIVMAAMVVLWAASGAFAVVYGASGYENYGYSESTAWEINSAAVLAKVRDDVNSGKNTIVEGGYFKLTKDIDLTSYTNWVPIGVGGTNSLNKDYHFFTGHFDGGGHTIKVNIAKIQLTTEDIPLFECYCALFGVITDSGSVKNLNVEGSVSFAARVHTARHFTGGIAAYLSGGTIENCKFDGSVSTSQLENSTSTIAYAGGIVGYAGRGGFYASYTKQSFAIIKNCKVGSKSATSINTKAYNSSTTNYAYAGGITAYFGDSASQSELSGNWVKADMYAGEYGATGGIFAGRNGLSGKVSNNTEVDPSEEDPDPDPEPEPTPGTASLTITKSSLASGTAGTAYSDTLTAQVTGGSYAVTWTATGLPSWLSLNSSTGALTGTPTSAGSYTFTVIALINTGTVITASKSYTLTVAAASQPAYTLTITKESLASGQVGTAYSDTLTATLPGTAVSPVWSVSSGSLPAGLILNASTGAITGTPTASGTYTFTVKASFLDFSDSKNYTVTITSSQPAYTLTITKDSLASGQVNTAYSDTLTAQLSGGTYAVTWGASGLPSWLSLNASTGALTGTPTAEGSYTFTVTAYVGQYSSDPKQFTLTVAGSNNDDDTPEIPITVEQPEFRNFSIMMEGQIGMNFYVYIPDDSYTPENCWMEFNVRGDTAHTPQPLDYTFTRTVNGVKLYGFRCYINAGQMADTITATLNYGNGQTITKDYSAKTYLDTALATPGFSQIIKNLMTAIKNFGHYVQPMLSKERGWVIGEKYLFMEAQTELTDDDINNAKQEVKSYAITKNLKGSGVSDVKFSLTMGSETTINVYIFPASGYSDSIAAYIDGSNQNNAILDGTRYKVQISNISAKNLGDMHTINIVADAESTVKISALSYADSILSSTLQQIGKVDIDTMRKAAAALYNYYKTARAYADSR